MGWLYTEFTPSTARSRRKSNIGRTAVKDRESKRPHEKRKNNQNERHAFFFCCCSFFDSTEIVPHFSLFLLAVSCLPAITHQASRPSSPHVRLKLPHSACPCLSVVCSFTPCSAPAAAERYPPLRTRGCKFSRALRCCTHAHIPPGALAGCRGCGSWFLALAVTPDGRCAPANH